jgi:opacity protein-like surface antigen
MGNVNRKVNLLMKKIIFKSAMLLIFLASASASAQTSKNNAGEDKFFLGLGAGLDYGGIGLRASFAATKNISAFGGVGYNLVDPAYNAGVMYKFMPHKKVSPTVLAMYGYNAAIKITDRRDLSKTYYGFTVGAGCHIKNRSLKNNWALEILLPFRNAAFTKDYNYWESRLQNKILPITVTIGYNFVLQKSKK